jgi:hypothetical protein
MVSTDLCLLCLADNNTKVKAVPGRVLCQKCIDYALAIKQRAIAAYEKPPRPALRVIKGGRI